MSKKSRPWTRQQRKAIRRRTWAAQFEAEFRGLVREGVLMALTDVFGTFPATFVGLSIDEMLNKTHP